MQRRETTPNIIFLEFNELCPPLLEKWMAAGHTDALRTPDDTVVFVSTEEAAEIHKDQVDCMGCLTQCAFSNWSQHEGNTTGRKTDPRSFCIQKKLQGAAHGEPLKDNLAFSGHNAINFSNDPFYSNGFVPTVKELVDRIVTGD
mgnify:CR=1 FL=1